jgi:hypothetical protein
MLDAQRLTLGRLAAGERFLYKFDFGDSWWHLCTIGAHRVDPLEELGISADRPLRYAGWGVIPDQYGRRWDADDGSSPVPADLVPGICRRLDPGSGLAVVVVLVSGD